MGKKKPWWQLASRSCWNRVSPWHASDLVSVLVGLRTYQHPGRCGPTVAKSIYELRHVRPSVCPYVCSHWSDFREILHGGLLWKLVENIQIRLKSDENIVHFTFRSMFYCCSENKFAINALLYNIQYLYTADWRHVSQLYTQNTIAFPVQQLLGKRA